MLNVLLIFIGFLSLIKGADFLVDGASQIAKKFHIPQMVIGLTIVSIGTSMPELVVSVTSALSGHSDISIGNIVGSNIANLFLILGICATIKPLAFNKQTRVIENPFTIFVTFLLFILCNNGGIENPHTVTKSEGAILLGLCILYMIYNVIMVKKGEKIEEIAEMDHVSKTIWQAIVDLIIGAVGLKFGGDLVVNSCVNIAKSFGICEEMISLTIVAISTSLPELITSITATKRGETDMAIRKYFRFPNF